MIGCVQYSSLKSLSAECGKCVFIRAVEKRKGIEQRISPCLAQEG